MHAWILLALLTTSIWGQGGSQPVRWQAHYTQIYSDDVETTAPILGPAFSLGPAGSLTSDPVEIVAGKESIKGSYFGSATATSFLSTNPSVLSLSPSHSYTVTFQYKILTAPGNYFVVQFFSPTAASQGKFLNAVPITGAAGANGTATLTSTLGSYSDYQVLWNIGTTGSIAIDNIQITDGATGKVIAAEDGETTAPTLKSGIQLKGGKVITVPSQTISGRGSVLLTDQGSLATNPAVLPLAANTVYTIQFDYQIVSRGSADGLFFAWFYPVGGTDPKSQVRLPTMLKNAEAAGTFSAGAQTAGTGPYTLNLFPYPGVSLIIDNIILYRQDVTTQTVAPPSWNRLLTLPYPRLGNKILAGTGGMAQFGWNEQPFTYTVAQIENRLAFADVIAGLPLENQTLDSDSVHRIRELNPNGVILSSVGFEAQQVPNAPPFGSDVNQRYQLLQSTPAEWKATDTAGKPISPVNYPNIFLMNLSDFVPVVNGQTWRTALQNFVTTQVFPAGHWDGVLLDGLEGSLDGGFPNGNDPALFNYDWNRNGVRDETLASSSDMIRAAKIQMLQQLNSSTNGMQLTIGNAGGSAPLALAPLVNGYTFECFNTVWNPPGSPIAASSSATWRTEFEAYLRTQATSRPPQLNILEACGASASDLSGATFSSGYLAPTVQDLQKHRLSMGTALLGNGYYEYDLQGPVSAPYWFDEYSVDRNGTAVEDRANKGYLGQPLSDAIELTGPGTVTFQEGFESGILGNAFTASPLGAVSISRNPGEVISGSGSLVLSNPDHTKVGSQVTAATNSAAVPLRAGGTYLLIFDWRILETFDSSIGFQIQVGGNAPSDHAFPIGVVSGDSGTTRFPFTVSQAGNWSINFAIRGGGGKVAIDNIKIYQGGVGPWRRDFENGFVLVNPFAQPHTFTAAESAGALRRTGIKRINGTQAPDVNNGQPVSGELTVGAFDAVILLADRIAVATPSITTVGTPGGFPDIAQNGWIEIHGTNLAPAGVAGGMTWDNAISFESAIMPTELGGVRVTVNGKPAFVYFVSSNQVNVLSPLDNTTGPVDIVVTSGGVSSAPFQPNLQAAAPSFPLVGSTSYVVATHADYSLVGPPSLSSPDYTFTPARRGETIILYAFGLGLPTSPLVNGVSTQSGLLPAYPQVQIGGANATVVFAGVVSPGLYQLNVTIPENVATGDNKIGLAYGGRTSPSGDMIKVQ